MPVIYAMFWPFDSCGGMLLLLLLILGWMVHSTASAAASVAKSDVGKEVGGRILGGWLESFFRGR